MIVVFVVDTSPSMGQRFSSTSDVDESFASKDRSAGSGMSRLDLAKMAVESLTKGLSRRVIEHNNQLQQESPASQKSLHNMGLGFSPPDQFLLLSTGRQYPHHPAVSSCGAGGRLLVGYGEYIMADQGMQHPGESPMQHGSNLEGFQKELKGLQATVWQPPPKPAAGAPVTNSPFPEDGGGAEGLNVALSAGLQLLSRYRLKNRSTENFGMGRLPSPAMLSPSGGGHAVHALQPACLVLITDGECLRKPPHEGGGTLKVQFGNMPLREFYKEPFRWDQRVFCLGVGGREGVSSTQYLHSQLRALSEVTGGCHMMLRSSGSLSQVTDILLRLISPPRPRELPISDPLRQQQAPQSLTTPVIKGNGAFVNGGPICCFQPLEATEADGGSRPIHRAMLLYVPHHGQPVASPDSNSPVIFQPPTWCIPEAFFPSKALDTLPPRAAQPLLTYLRYPKQLGSKSFDAAALMNALQRLDQLLASRFVASQGAGHAHHHARVLHRDVYICEWLSVDGRAGKPPISARGMEYFPVLIQGAGRSLSEGDESFLNFGILHVPQGASTLASTTSRDARYTTLTLLPPEPQILLPLLIKAAEAELRAMKKAAPDVKEGAAGMGATAGLIQKQTGSVARNVHLDENWRTEFRAYLFRVPPYYQNALKRALRHILPTSVHPMLSAEGIDAVASQCFSKVCLQKIRNGEQVARETTDRLERQEAELRRRGLAITESHPKSAQAPKTRWGSDSADTGAPVIGYGQYDPRSTTERYLAALRSMPPPWRSGVASNFKSKDNSRIENAIQDALSETASAMSMAESRPPTALDVLGDLPASCLLPYYESRRRWIFGGSGLTTRGLHVEGVNNDGSNSQRRKGKWTIDDEPLISLAGVGASTLNHTTTEKMGNYRERLLWSRSPVVGYGFNETTGVAATTAPDGSPHVSVDDDAMPITFFDPKTGEFSDSVQARVRSRLLVNFGNPFKEKRGDSIVPEKFRTPAHQRGVGQVTDDGPMTPPGSPPHDSFSGEGEGEAVFAGKPTWKGPARPTSPRKRDSSSLETETPPPEAKKAKSEPVMTTAVSIEQPGKVQTTSKPTVPAPPPPKPRNPTVNPHRPAPPPKPPQRKPPPPPPPTAGSKQPPEPQSEKKVSKGPPPPKPPAPAPKQNPNLVPAPQAETPSLDVKLKQNPSPAPALQGDTPSPDVKLKQNPSPVPAPQAEIPSPEVNLKQNPGPAPAPQADTLSLDLKPKQAVVTVPPQPLDMQTPDVKPKVDLPPGWICVWSKSQKRWYFFDTKSNRSVWQWPPPPS